MVWADNIGTSITLPSDKNPADTTDKRDWVQIGGNLPDELIAAGYNAALLFYNGKWVGAGSEVKYFALTPLGDSIAQERFRIVFCSTFDGGTPTLMTVLDVPFSGPKSNITGFSMENPRALDVQETLPNSLVRYDALTSYVNTAIGNYSLVFPEGLTSLVPLLGAAWVPWDVGVNMPAYQKDVTNRVYLTGIVMLANNGSQLGAGQGAAVCTLPSGHYSIYRNQQFAVPMFSSAGVYIGTGNALVNSSGVLTVVNNTNALVGPGTGWSLAPINLTTA